MTEFSQVREPGKRTSVYLSAELDAAVKASGVGLAELVRRGLDRDPVNERLAERAAVRAAEMVADDVERAAAAGVRSVLRDAQGGAW